MEKLEKFIKEQQNSYKDYKKRLEHNKDTASSLGFYVQSKILLEDIRWVNDTLRILDAIQTIIDNEKNG